MSRVELALDTSGSFCSVAALLPGGGVVERSSEGDGDHFERLPALVEEVCREAGVSAKQLGAVRVGVGPGSFTGLRIGMSFAKGLAYASSAPLMGVCSFRGLAAAACQQRPEARRFVVLSDARRDEVFAAAFERDERGGVATVVPPCIVPISSLGAPEWSAPAAWWVTTLRDFSLPMHKLDALPCTARGLLRCGPALETYSLTDIAALEPSYLRAVAAKTIAERQQGA